MARYVDHVIHASQYSEIAVHGQHVSGRRKRGPVAPLLAVAILAIFLVILSDESFAIAPNGLHDPGPRIANDDVARLPRSCRDFLVVLVINRRIDSRHAWARASRLHRIKRGFRAAQEAPVLRLPPGVDNDCLALADGLVVPAPDLGLDGFSHRGHVFEMVVVLGGFIVPGLTRSEER